MSAERDPELDEILGGWKAAAPDETAHARAWHRASTAFSNAASAGSKSKQEPVWARWLQPAPLVLGMVLGALILGMAWWNSASSGDEADRKLLAELKKMFPGQLQAALLYPDRDLKLLLDPAKAGSASQPVMVELSGGGRQLKILTFSGSRFNVEELDGGRDLEVLATEDGGVLLVGLGRVWDLKPTQTVHLEDGLSLKAECL